MNQVHDHDVGAAPTNDEAATEGVSDCCSRLQQATCCEPSEKAGCCGPERAASSTPTPTPATSGKCGCQS